ncbi:hypothetical protein C815_01357 [Firmicutes bacterium M10-2]|nr:hypothetical protein C815_01357 [Firmicutes bacterium M10-2]
MKELFISLITFAFVFGSILKPCEIHHQDDLCWMKEEEIEPYGTEYGNE